MISRLFLLFAIIPVMELYVLIEVGTAIGTINTVAIIITTAFIGAYLTKSQGFYVVARIREAINYGRLPGLELLHGFFVLVGGITLLTPGFLTDMLGFSMLIPQIRGVYVGHANKYIKKKIDSGQWNISSHYR